MDAREFQTSTDPVAMLDWLCGVTESVYGFPAEQARLPSKRKLGLFSIHLYGNLIVGISKYSWTQWRKNIGTGRRPACGEYDHNRVREYLVYKDAVMAGVLRDLTGDPEKPTRLDAYRTPNVVETARGLFFAKRPCIHWECKGRGKWTGATGDTEECGFCSKTGEIDDGVLDPFGVGLLADALEDAGMPETDPAMTHLREIKTHWRGCHVVDACMGEE